jgi:hypothetical protein
MMCIDRWTIRLVIEVVLERSYLVILRPNYLKRHKHVHNSGFQDYWGTRTNAVEDPKLFRIWKEDITTEILGSQ